MKSRFVRVYGGGGLLRHSVSRIRRHVSRDRVETSNDKLGMESLE